MTPPGNVQQRQDGREGGWARGGRGGIYPHSAPRLPAATRLPHGARVAGEFQVRARLTHSRHPVALHPRASFMHETLTGGFYYLKNTSKTIWILVMSKLKRARALSNEGAKYATDPFHVTRVVSGSLARTTAPTLAQRRAGGRAVGAGAGGCQHQHRWVPAPAPALTWRLTSAVAPSPARSRVCRPRWPAASN